ncbi:Yqey-like protein-domain-containing protein, partial [Dimargaris cristalligena]
TTISATMFSQLKQDLKASMRSKDQVRLGVIRSVLSAVTYHEKALIMKGRSAEESKIEAQQDPSVVSIVQSAQKKRRDAVALYQGAGRSDLAEQEAKELAILQSFLPEPYTPAEIDAHVQAAITATEAKSIRDLGRVIKSLTLDPARAPKAQLAETAKRLLASAK